MRWLAASAKLTGPSGALALVLFSLGAASCRDDGVAPPAVSGSGGAAGEAGEAGDPGETDAAGDAGMGASGGAVGSDAGSGNEPEPHDPEVPCLDHADCDDGKYCNGRELCLAKFEGADVKLCTSPERPPCGENTCYEETHTCDCTVSDHDGDTFPVEGCADGDKPFDCDDTDRTRYPGRTEACDSDDPEHDEDCDDRTFGDKDSDEDGYFDHACANASAYVFAGTEERRLERRGNDCNDVRRDIHPLATEICDELDNNCNGEIDEVFGAPLGETHEFYYDADGDHWGDDDQLLRTLCNNPPLHYAVLNGDCDDDDPEVAPGRGEACNGVDDDCNERIDDPLTPGALLFDEPYDGETEFECKGEEGWTIKTCPPDRLNCGDMTYRDGCETIGTTLCNCQACGRACTFSCGATGCEEIAELTTGFTHTCALLRGEGDGEEPSAGRVACWGRNALGLLGDGTTRDSAIPVLVSELSDVTAISAGERHTCAVAGGQLSCWGDNEFGQLGDGQREPFSEFPSVALPLHGIGSPVALASGAFHSCAVYDSGALACWGHDDFGQIGRGGGGPVNNLPIQVMRQTAGGLEFILEASQVAAGTQHTCALSAGTVECWGDNSQGQLGEDPDLVPMLSLAHPVPGLENLVVDEIAAAGFHTCARAGSDVYCWGSNYDHELANDAGPIGLPTHIELPTAARAISAGLYFACALDEAGAIRCWGSNQYGERGSPEEMPGIAPTSITLEPATGVFGGNGRHVCALVQGRGAWCWGNNDRGQLGDGEISTDLQITARPVLPLKGSRTCPSLD